MKILIYVNREKDKSDVWLNGVVSFLQKRNVEYETVFNKDLSASFKGDAILVLGGDGTILGLTDFCLKNSLSIIGINAGKMGFLTEFEPSETEKAIDLFLNGELKADKRATLKAAFNEKVYFGLNDLVVERIFHGEDGASVIKLDVSVHQKKVDVIRGNGVIVATPTGSTAYSLSSGGSILAPRINAFSITPIAAHSLTRRPIIYSSEAECSVSLTAGKQAGVIIDGKFIGKLAENQTVSIYKSSRDLVFLRKKEFNFYKRLSDKFGKEENV